MFEPGHTNPSGMSRVEGWAIEDSHKSDSMSQLFRDAHKNGHPWGGWQGVKKNIREQDKDGERE